MYQRWNDYIRFVEVVYDFQNQPGPKYDSTYIVTMRAESEKIQDS